MEMKLLNTLLYANMNTGRDVGLKHVGARSQLNWSLSVCGYKLSSLVLLSIMNNATLTLLLFQTHLHLESPLCDHSLSFLIKINCQDSKNKKNNQHSELCK